MLISKYCVISPLIPSAKAQNNIICFSLNRIPYEPHHEHHDYRVSLAEKTLICFQVYAHQVFQVQITRTR